MPNGLMTVQRLICPSASEMGGLAAPEGVLAVDWRMVEEVHFVHCACSHLFLSCFGSMRWGLQYEVFVCENYSEREVWVCRRVLGGAQVMSRPEVAQQPADQGYRPSMAGDPRFPRGAQPFRKPSDGQIAVPVRS